MSDAYYLPHLNYVELSQKIAVFRIKHRTETGERFPKEVDARLRTLDEAVNEVELCGNAAEERLKLQNALIELRNAQETIEKHGLPEPKLLAQVQIDFTRVYNELDPDKSQGRSR